MTRINDWMAGMMDMTIVSLEIRSLDSIINKVVINIRVQYSPIPVVCHMTSIINTGNLYVVCVCVCVCVCIHVELSMNITGWYNRWPN